MTDNTTHSLDRIDLTGFKRATLRDQPQPMLIWARIDQLVIDRRYQRTLTPKGRGAIQRIANEWDWRKYQPILVAPANGGTLAVVDGQHRAHAAALAGLEAIPAMTVAMTLQEQAAGFAAVNRDRVTISIHQIYRAELAAGTDWAIACRDAVHAAGCSLATYTPNNSTKKPGIVYAVGLVRRMVKNGEGEAITNGLRAIRQSRQSDTLRPYDGGVLAPWLTAVAKNQRFASLPLADLFDSIDIDTLTDVARIRARQTGDSARSIVTQRIVDHLRAALREQVA